MALEEGGRKLIRLIQLERSDWAGGWYTVVKAYTVGLTHLNGKQVHGLTINFSNSTTNERIDRTEICLELNTMDHDMIGLLIIKSTGCRV